MREVRPDVWWWTARHPEWTPESDGWGPEVSSYAYVTDATCVLFDPLLDARVLAELEHALTGREVVVLLTHNGHERSSRMLVERFGAAVYAPAVSRAPLGVPSMSFEVGDTLAAGVRATTAHYPNEATFWIEGPRALVAGDVLLGDAARGVRVPPDSWLAPGVARAELERGLRPLLELPLEALLSAHGPPLTHGAHARLSEALAG